MDDLEIENGELREEITAFRESLEILNSMAEALAVTQNRPSQEEQRTVISDIGHTPIPRYVVPPNRP